MAIDVEGLIIIKNNIVMSNERTGVDRVLDWIVPIRLSGKWMNVEVERGVKIMLSLILLATIPTHAIVRRLRCCLRMRWIVWYGLNSVCICYVILLYMWALSLEFCC